MSTYFKSEQHIRNVLAARNKAIEVQNPKNPYCMKLDEEKLDKVTSAGIVVVYGSLETLYSYIDRLDGGFVD